MEESENIRLYLITEDQINQMIEKAIERYANKDGPFFTDQTICSKSDAAKRLGKHRASIHNMIADGRLKASADGKGVLISSIIEYESGKKNQNCQAAISKRGKKVYV